MTRINGETKLYGLIGHPVKHSLSPLIQNTLSIVMGLNNVYLCFDTPPGQLEKKVTSLIGVGVEGFNVTMPHKEEVIKYIDELSESALYVNAVNTVFVDKGIAKGFNTDCEGFVRSLKENFGYGVEGDSVLMLGAGGAAKAIAVGLLQDGCKKLYIQNRTLKRAKDLKDSLPDFSDRIEVVEDIKLIPEDVDVIVNTTSVGMHGELEGKSPLSDGYEFNKNQRVVDIIYSPPETLLLKKAREKGASTLNGYSMLFWQAVIAFEIWNKVKVGRDELDEILKILKENGVMI
ncbi:MAG: shikimate dehydrogenase [Clostridiaceae bacterium]|nr:shikimate dehydrogenase [Clostridiaceae bacterium]